MIYTSRSERRQQRLIYAAEKGLKSLEGQILYLSEIKKLTKEGFVIVESETFDSKKKLYCCTISWQEAYKDGIPPMVLDYIYAVIESYPKNFVNSFAQELFITSARVNAKMHH